MKLLQTLLRQKIILSTLTIVIFGGMVYGVNKLGGLLFRDESLLCLTRRSGSLSRLEAMIVTPDGQTIVTGGRQIKFWDVGTGQKQGEIATLRSRIDGIVNPSFSVSELMVTPNQQALISSTSLLNTGKNSNNPIQIWDLTTREQIRTLPGHTTRVRFLAVSPDGQILVSQDESGVVHIWNLSTGQIKTTIETQAQKRFPIIFSPDSKTFVTMTSNTAIFWDIESGNSIGQITVDSSHTPLAISADNKMLLIQNAGSVKRLREIDTGKEQLTIKDSLIEYPFARTPDGRQILIQTESGIKLYDFLTGVEVKSFMNTEYLQRIDISPDGKSFLTIDSRGRFVLRALQTGSIIWELEGRAGRGTHAFTPDSQILVNVSRAGNDITIWDLDTGKRIRRFCNH